MPARKLPIGLATTIRAARKFEARVRAEAAERRVDLVAARAAGAAFVTAFTAAVARVPEAEQRALARWIVEELGR